MELREVDGNRTTTPARSSEARGSEMLVRLAELARLFSENVTAATRDFVREVSSELELEGMSVRGKRRAKQQAEARGLDGFVLTLDAASYEPAMASLDDRALRKALYEAYHTRASDRGPRAGRFDNTPVLDEMLELRHLLALSLGYQNYAQLALRDCAYSNPDEVERRLVSHHRGTKARAQAELDQLWAFAKQKGAPRGFSNWDLPYYAEWRAREEIGVTEAELEEYFALGSAVAGAWFVARESLGVSVAPMFSEAAAACERRLYRVADREGVAIGLLELDAFGPGDASGEVRVVLLAEPEASLPLARVACGFEPPLGGLEQLSHGEVDALFRGVGRALFLLVTGAPPGEGLSPERALGSEVAGRHFERFASHFDTLKTFARHRETDRALPPELFQKLLQRKLQHAGINASQELELALFDLRAHRDHVPVGRSTQLRAQVLDTFIQIRREQSVLPASYWTRFANTCTPIFAYDEPVRLWQRDWARQMGSALFRWLEERGFSSAAQGHLRDTFWVAGERSASARLEGALGQLPSFGSP